MPNTSNHNYNVPNKGDQDWHQPLNDNFEQFDTDVEIRDADSNKGNYDPKAGAKFFALDTETVYVGTGSSWQEIESTGRNPTLETISPSGDFLGLGRSSPLTNAEYLGITAPVSGSDFAGMYLDTDVSGGKPFYGYATGGSTAAYHYFDGSTDKWHLFNGGEQLTVQSDGTVGVGTQSPNWQFDVRSGEQYAIWGETSNSDPNAAGVYGKNSDGIGVVGVGDENGMRAVATSGSGVGINPVNNSGGRAIVADGHATINGNTRVNQQFIAAADARVDQDLRVLGNLTVDGSKNFAQAVETPDGEREVTYTAVEAPDARTEVSGVAELEDGRAEVELPEHFAWVTDADEPIIAQVTPHAGAPVQPQVTERSLGAIVVEDFGDGPDDYEVSYTVTGTRDGFADEPVVREPDGGEPTTDDPASDPVGDGPTPVGDGPADDHGSTAAADDSAGLPADD